MHEALLVLCMAPVSQPFPGFSHSNGCALFVSGYRAVPLKNNYSENLELASLLVKIEIFPGKVRLVHLNIVLLRNTGERIHRWA